MALTVYSGCMFSGKTKSLIQHVNRIKKEEEIESSVKGIYVYKPSIDDRYEAKKISSHDGNSIDINKEIDVDDYGDVRRIASKKAKWDTIAIDEAQFFPDEALLYAVNKLLDIGADVVAATLDTDFCNNTFETSAKLLAKADFLNKKSAICNKCGDVATRTQRINSSGRIAPASEARIKIGGDDDYEARCPECWVDPKTV